MVGAGRSQRERFADSPKAQQTNTKLALQTAAGTVCLQTPLDGITDVSRDIPEVRQPGRIARDSVPVIFDNQIRFAALAPSRDGNVLRMCVDAVLYKLRDGFQRIRL